MHIIAIAVIIALIVLIIIMSRGTLRAGDTGSASAQPGVSARPWRHGLAFISNGKLFYQAPDRKSANCKAPTSGQ